MCSNESKRLTDGGQRPEAKRRFQEKKESTSRSHRSARARASGSIKGQTTTTRTRSSHCWPPARRKQNEWSASSIEIIKLIIRIPVEDNNNSNKATKETKNKKEKEKSHQLHDHITSNHCNTKRQERQNQIKKEDKKIYTKNKKNKITKQRQLHKKTRRKIAAAPSRFGGKIYLKEKQNNKIIYIITIIIIITIIQVNNNNNNDNGREGLFNSLAKALPFSYSSFAGFSSSCRDSRERKESSCEYLCYAYLCFSRSQATTSAAAIPFEPVLPVHYFSAGNRNRVFVEVQFSDASASELVMQMRWRFISSRSSQNCSKIKTTSRQLNARRPIPRTSATSPNSRRLQSSGSLVSGAIIQLIGAAGNSMMILNRQKEHEEQKMVLSLSSKMEGFERTMEGNWRNEQTKRAGVSLVVVTLEPTLWAQTNYRHCYCCYPNYYPRSSPSHLITLIRSNTHSDDNHNDNHIPPPLLVQHASRHSRAALYSNSYLTTRCTSRALNFDQIKRPRRTQSIEQQDSSRSPESAHASSFISRCKCLSIRLLFSTPKATPDGPTGGSTTISGRRRPIWRVPTFGCCLKSRRPEIQSVTWSRGVAHLARFAPPSSWIFVCSTAAASSAHHLHPRADRLARVRQRLALVKIHQLSNVLARQRKRNSRTSKTTTTTESSTINQKVSLSVAARAVSQVTLPKSVKSIGTPEAAAPAVTTTTEAGHRHPQQQQQQQMDLDVAQMAPSKQFTRGRDLRKCSVMCCCSAPKQGQHNKHKHAHLKHTRWQLAYWLLAALFFHLTADPLARVSCLSAAQSTSNPGGSSHLSLGLGVERELELERVDSLAQLLRPAGNMNQALANNDNAGANDQLQMTRPAFLPAPSAQQNNNNNPEPRLGPEDTDYPSLLSISSHSSVPGLSSLAPAGHANYTQSSNAFLERPEEPKEKSTTTAKRNNPPSQTRQQYQTLRWPFIGLIGFMFLGASGNILVCLAVWRERRLQTATNFFLLSLAVADLLVCVLVMPFGIIDELYGHWPFDWRICNVWVTSDVLTCSSSILHMCFISVGRYLGIRNPLHARQASNLFVSRRAVLWRIAIAWMFAAIIASPITLMSWRDHRNIMPEARECAISNNYFLFFGSLFAFFIPMFIMVPSYVMTVRLLSQRAKFVRNDSLAFEQGAAAAAGSSSSSGGHLGAAGRRLSRAVELVMAAQRRQSHAATEQNQAAAPNSLSATGHAGARANGDPTTDAGRRIVERESELKFPRTGHDEKEPAITPPNVPFGSALKEAQFIDEQSPPANKSNCDQQQPHHQQSGSRCKPASARPRSCCHSTTTTTTSSHCCHCTCHKCRCCGHCLRRNTCAEPRGNTSSSSSSAARHSLGAARRSPKRLASPHLEAGQEADTEKADKKALDIGQLIQEISRVDKSSRAPLGHSDLINVRPFVATTGQDRAKPLDSGCHSFKLVDAAQSRPHHHSPRRACQSASGPASPSGRANLDSNSLGQLHRNPIDPLKCPPAPRGTSPEGANPTTHCLEFSPKVAIGATTELSQEEARSLAKIDDNAITHNSAKLICDTDSAPGDSAPANSQTQVIGRLRLAHRSHRLSIPINQSDSLANRESSEKSRQTQTKSGHNNVMISLTKDLNHGGGGGGGDDDDDDNNNDNNDDYYHRDRQSANPIVTCDTKNCDHQANSYNDDDSNPRSPLLGRTGKQTPNKSGTSPDHDEVKHRHKLDCRRQQGSPSPSKAANGPKSSDRLAVKSSKQHNKNHHRHYHHHHHHHHVHHHHHLCPKHPNQQHQQAEDAPSGAAPNHQHQLQIHRSDCPHAHGHSCGRPHDKARSPGARQLATGETTADESPAALASSGDGPELEGANQAALTSNETHHDQSKLQQQQPQQANSIRDTSTNSHSKQVALTKTFANSINLPQRSANKIIKRLGLISSSVDSETGTPANGDTRTPLKDTRGTLNSQSLLSHERPQMIRYLGSSMQVRSEQKATKVLGVVFFTFVICWTPFFVINFAQAFVDRNQLSAWISAEMMTTFLWLGYISSTINPIIYTVFNRNFRSAFRNLLLCQTPRPERFINRHAHGDTFNGKSLRNSQSTRTGHPQNGLGPLTMNQGDFSNSAALAAAHWARTHRGVGGQSGQSRLNRSPNTNKSQQHPGGLSAANNNSRAIGPKATPRIMMMEA